MAGSSRIAISWADLPKELLDKISKSLDTETDSRRFRAVCNSWRTSTTPLKKFPFTPLKLPFPFAAGETSHPNHDGAYLSLTVRTVYRLISPNCRDPDFWLVKIEISKDGKSRLLNPVSDHEIKLLPEIQMPKVLNTLDFRVSEVCKGYTLDYVNPAKPNENYEYKFAKKIAVSAGDNGEYVIMAIDDGNKLWYIKSGDKEWNKVCDRRFSNNFRDIVNYKGEFYGIDAWGGAWLFDSMFEGKSIIYSAGHGASKRHLVEISSGELVLVDVVTDKDKQVCTCYDIDDGCHCNFPRTPVRNTAEEVIISRMDKSRGEWIKAKTEFNEIIFVGDDCSFSFSAEEFKKGCKGTRVFYSDRYICFRTEEEKKPHSHVDYDYGYDYDGDGPDGDDDDDDNCGYGYNYWECDCCDSSDEDTGKVDNFVPSDDVKIKFRGLHSHNTGVCDFESGKLGSVLKFPEYAEIFWPPPCWLNRS